MSDIVWSRPEWLRLLWILPVFVPLAIWSHRRTVRAARRFAGEVMAERLMPKLSPLGPGLGTAGFVLGVGLVILSAAGPAWDFEYVPVEATGLDVAVVLDVSRSMLADDGGESRLERARALIDGLASELTGDRIGLVLFAGETLVTCPLTFDRAFLRQALREAAPGVAGRGGTFIGPALDAGLELLDENRERDKVLILVTDAGDQDSFPRRAAERLAEREVQVVALGIGRTASPDQPLVIDGQIIRDEGKPVPAAVDTQLLRDLAEATRGIAIPPDESFRLNELYARHVAPLDRGVGETREEKRWIDRFQWFLLPGILLLVASAFAWSYPREQRKGRKVKALNASATARALVFGLVAFLVSCGNDDSAYELARRQLVEGSVQEAIAAFEALAEEDARPEVFHALGCALVAEGREAEAREALARVLERGERDLRARALVALAALEVAALDELGGEEPEALREEDREELRGRAEAALDQLQRARNLSPELEDAQTRQEALGFWLRALEDAWATRDRDQRRAELAERPGRAWLLGVIEEQTRIGQALIDGASHTALSLDQRALAEDVQRFGPEKLEAQPGGPLPSLKEAIGQRLNDVVPLMMAASEDLARPDAAARMPSWTRSLNALVATQVLWSSQREALEVVAGQAQGMATAIQRGIAELKAAASTEVAGLMANLLGSSQESVQALVQRIDAQPEETRGPARSFIEQSVDRASGLRGESLAALEGRSLGGFVEREREIAQLLLEAAADAAMAEREPADLARALERETRGAILSLSRFDPLVGVSLDELREDTFTRLERRHGYFVPVLEAQMSRGQPGQPAPTEEVLAERLKALGPVRTLAEAAIGDLATGREKAAEAILEVGPEVRAPMQAARQKMRALWTVLASLDDVLDGTVEDAEALLATHKAARKLANEAKEGTYPPALREVPLAPDAQTEEQRLVLATIGDMLRQGIPRERGDAPLANADPSAPAPEPTPERVALLSALDAVARALETAEDYGREVMDALASPLPDGDLTATASLHAMVKTPLEGELLALVEARDTLARARLGLGEIARQLANNAEIGAQAAHEIAGGREFVVGDQVIGSDGLVATATLEIAPLVALLDGAFDRFQRESRPQPAEGSEEPDPEAMQAYESMVAYLGALRDQIEEASADLTAHVLVPDQEESAEPLFVALRDRARAMWGLLAMNDFTGAVRETRGQEAQWLGLLGGLREGDETAPERRARLAVGQRWIGELVPMLEQALERAAAAGEQGGLTEKTVTVARENLPLAASEMERAATALDADERETAAEAATEVVRLLDEILDSQEDQDQNESGQDQQRQQGQEGQQQEVDPSQLSEEERERLARAIEERARDLEKNERRFRKRPAVEKDW